MAADTASSGAGDVPCPDPSVHQHQHKLSEQASTAALYVTHPERQSDRGGSSGGDARESPLGADGKLSSKSAAASLKHAKPQELPSFPSHGVTADSAGKAALLAKDYKMKELWQPKQSLAGSKAAVMAAGKGGKLDLWQASATPEGHSAATLAMRNKGLSPQTYTGVDADNRSKALLAATMSHNKGRQRAGSTPTPANPAYPDSQNATKNALNAATVSHSTSRSTKGMAPDGWSSEAMQAARIKNVGTHMGGAEQWGEHPTVEIPGEREEAKHQAALRASAVSMAKTIYETQNRTALTDDPEEIAARAAAGRSSTTSQSDIKQEAMRYINLQEAAHKLASERLAKVDKSFEDARYRQYYGYDDKPKRLSSRMSLRSVGGGRQRTRASSDGATDRYDDSDDEEQARRIRTQMSQLSTGLGQVDQKKQQDDRARLLAAAEKKVTARMHNMDEKVYADTGKIPPALMEEWEAKARERAQKERELQAQNPGKTHIGGGKFMEQSEIDAIAAARLKPTLDEINDTAEKRRARDEELRLEKEEQERTKRFEKAEKKQEKDEQKRVKNEEKAEAKKIKDEEKARKAEEKRVKDEEKRIAKEEKRKSKEQHREEAQDAAAATAGGAALGEVADKVKDDNEPADDAAYQKHQSALGRLKEKFRKSQLPEGKKSTDTEERPSSGVNKNAAAGVAGGAATGTTLEEVAHDKRDHTPAPLDSQEATHAVAKDDDDKVPSPLTAEDATQHPVAAVDSETTRDVHAVDKWNPVPSAAAATTVPAIVADDDGDADAEDEDEDAKPQRPKFEQQPSLVGYSNDRGTSDTMPNLERHISAIPDSESDDEEDWNDEKTVPPTKSAAPEHAEGVAERVAAAPVVATSAAPVPSEIQHEETASRMDDQRAEPPKDLPSTMETPGVPKPAAATEPTEKRLSTDPDHKEHTILRQIVNPHGKKHDDQAFGSNAQEVAVPAEGKKSTESKEKPSKLQKKDAPAAVAAGGSKSPTSPASSDKEHKGLRGFLSKFGSKKSKDKESKYPEFKSAGKGSKDRKESEQSSSVPYEETKAGDKPIHTGTAATAGAATGAATGAGAFAAAHDKSVEPSATSPTLPQVDAGPSLTENPGTEGAVGRRSDSPSSFKRGENEPNNLDDVSSSGAEEEDIARGRGGRFARKLGFGNSRTTKDEGKGKAPAKDGNGERQNSTEDEQFEEARDHFDETLAPPPAFAGQAKSESPVRGTKFQEEF